MLGVDVARNGAAIVISPPSCPGGVKKVVQSMWTSVLCGIFLHVILRSYCCRGGYCS